MEVEPHIWFPIIIILFLCVTIVPISRSEQPDGYSECYSPFQCGNWIDLRYPFWSAKLRRPSYCGGVGFELHCPEDEAEYPSITFDSQTFNITSIHYDSRLSLYNMKLVRPNVDYEDCFSHLTNTSLNTSKISKIYVSYESDVKIVTLLYHCPANISGEGLYNFTCQDYYQSNNRVYYYYVNQSPDEVSPQLQLCEDRIQVPISGGVSLPVEGDIYDLNHYLNQEFDVAVFDSRCADCWFSKGICGSNSINTSQFICYYRRDAIPSDDSHPNNLWFKRTKLIIDDKSNYDRRKEKKEKREGIVLMQNNGKY